MAQAPRLLAGLFTDGGERFLREGGLGAHWSEALSTVPPVVLQVPAQAAGLRQLSRLRDFWAAENDLQPAVAASRALLDIRARVVGQEHPDTFMELGALGALVQRAGRVDEGAKLLERAYDGLRTSGTQDIRLAVVAANMGMHLVKVGDLVGAEVALREAFSLRERVAPRTVERTAAQLAEVLRRLEREVEALPLYKRSWEVCRAELGVDHPRTLVRTQALGNSFARLQRWEEAATALRPVQDAHRGRPMDEEGAAVAFDLGLALSRSGQMEEGTRCVEASVKWTRQESDRTPHRELPNRLSEWANLQLARGRGEEAEGLVREALELERRLHGDHSIEVALRYLELGQFCVRQGRIDEALGWIDPAASMHRTLLGDQHPSTRIAVEAQLELLVQRAQVALAAREKALALDLLDAAVSQAGPVLGFAHTKVRHARELLDPLIPKSS